jgi:hypothetical protein
MHKGKPILIAPLSLHMEPALRQIIERFADSERISLNKAGRTLLIEGARVCIDSRLDVRVVAPVWTDSQD